MVRDMFCRIREAGLKIRTNKWLIGFRSVGFTGHYVWMEYCPWKKTSLPKIRDAQQPETKRQVQAFLKVVHRKFVSSFAEVAAPLTDLPKKGCPNKVVWKLQHKHSFKLWSISFVCTHSEVSWLQAQVYLADRCVRNRGRKFITLTVREWLAMQTRNSPKENKTTLLLKRVPSYCVR